MLFPMEVINYFWMVNLDCPKIDQHGFWKELYMQCVVYVTQSH